MALRMVWTNDAAYADRFQPYGDGTDPNGFNSKQRSIDDGAWFEVLRDIEPGEELFVDCGTLVEDEEA